MNERGESPALLNVARSNGESNPLPSTISAKPSVSRWSRPTSVPFRGNSRMATATIYQHQVRYFHRGSWCCSTHPTISLPGSNVFFLELRPEPSTEDPNQEPQKIRRKIVRQTPASSPSRGRASRPPRGTTRTRPPSRCTRNPGKPVRIESHHGSNGVGWAWRRDSNFGRRSQLSSGSRGRGGHLLRLAQREDTPREEAQRTGIDPGLSLYLASREASSRQFPGEEPRRNAHTLECAHLGCHVPNGPCPARHRVSLIGFRSSGDPLCQSKVCRRS